MNADERKLAVVYVASAIGLPVIAYQGYKHMFVDGITDEERSGLMRGGLMMLSVWFVKTYVDLSFLGPYQDWLDPTGVMRSDT